MHFKLTGFSLNPSGAQRLREQLGNTSNQSATALIAHILDLGAHYAVLEEPYIDKDYSADYQNFYSSAFKDYQRTTTRVHLFTEDISDWSNRPLTEQANDTELSNRYLGFVVVRPIPQGPIGRTILKFPELKNGLCVRPAARAEFEVHLLGTKLKVRGSPFIQQDRRIGACAQAAIWMAARTMHARHKRTGWHSTADITQFATTPTDAELSLELPAGSTGLNPIHMIRALKAMGFQPLHHYFAEKAEETEPTKEQPAKEVIFRYLDSGLPVIMGITKSTLGIAHAVSAVGYVEVTGAACRPGSTYDVFVRAFVVHDDQRGPYRYMPLTKEDVPHLPQEHLLMQGTDVLTVEDVVSHIFVPMPARVFLRAESADIVGRDFLDQQVQGNGVSLVDHATQPKAKEGLTAFYAQARDEKLVRRTYLTSAGRYRHHLAKGTLNEPIKAELLSRTLPHFVWVTEFVDPQAELCSPKGARSILGHLLINATSSDDPDNDLLAAHFPHAVIHKDINKPEGADGRITASIFPEDTAYSGRVREP